MEPADFYGIRGASFTALLHGDDPDRLRALAASATGQRYIHHETRGSRVLLFVREQRKQGGVTEPFVCLGFTRYESHEGERPMAIRWRLQQPIPEAWLPVIGLAV